VLIPVAARSKAWVCGRSLAGIAGSNPTRGMNVCLVSVVCSQVWISASGWSLVQRSPTGCGVSWVWSWSLDNEEAMANWGLLRNRNCIKWFGNEIKPELFSFWKSILNTFVFAVFLSLGLRTQKWLWRYPYRRTGISPCFQPKLLKQSDGLDKPKVTTEAVFCLTQPTAWKLLSWRKGCVSAAWHEANRKQLTRLISPLTIPLSYMFVVTDVT
jgi:hypothetical protein